VDHESVARLKHLRNNDCEKRKYMQKCKNGKNKMLREEIIEKCKGG